MTKPIKYCYLLLHIFPRIVQFWQRELCDFHKRPNRFYKLVSMNTFLFLMLKFQLLESIEITKLVHIETIKCNMLFLIVFFCVCVCVCMRTFSTSFISFLIVPVSASKSFKLKPQKKKKRSVRREKGQKFWRGTLNPWLWATHALQAW